MVMCCFFFIKQIYCLDILTQDAKKYINGLNYGILEVHEYFATMMRRKVFQLF